MPREIPVVIRKNGDRFVPKFPVELEAGDRFIIAWEMAGTRVPKGMKWTVNGYTSSGPVIAYKG